MVVFLFAHSHIKFSNNMFYGFNNQLSHPSLQTSIIHCFSSDLERVRIDESTFKVIEGQRNY